MTLATEAEVTHALRLTVRRGRSRTHSEATLDEGREGVRRRMSPTDAERMSRGAREDLVALIRIKIGCCLQEAGAESKRLLTRALDVIDVEVDVHLLLGGAIWPLGRGVVGCQLHADTPRAGGVEDAMELLVVVDDVTLKEAGPKRAFGVDVGGVKDHNLANHFHRWEVIRLAERGAALIAPFVKAQIQQLRG